MYIHLINHTTPLFLHIIDMIFKQYFMSKYSDYYYYFFFFSGQIKQTKISDEISINFTRCACDTDPP